MKLSNITIPLPLLVFASIVNATCYTTGLEGDRTQAHQQVGRMCDFLSGNYGPGEAKHHAFTYAGDAFDWRRWDFWVTNLNANAGFNSHDGCVEFLNREINCLQGGETTYSNLGWKFL